MSILENWQQWKDFLGDRLNQAEDQGVRGNTINELAFQVGDYLAKQVDPKNEQERVLSDFGLLLVRKNNMRLRISW